METMSPPVSPRVVQSIFTSQKSRVTSGTLLRALSAVLFTFLSLLLAVARAILASAGFGHRKYETIPGSSGFPLCPWYSCRPNYSSAANP